MNYNLIEEPWIDCTFLDGSEKSLGLMELFERAHEIRGFHTDPPLVEAVLMKIVLAISHRVLDGPADKKAWRDACKKGKYDEKRINEYFEKWYERFDLFHPLYPFMQNGKLTRQTNRSEETIEPLSISILLPHKASGNNVTLFDHTTDKSSLQLSPKESAYALMLGNNYLFGGTFKKGSDLCGWQGNCLHAPMVNGYHVFVLGDSLFETLVLNTLTPQLLGPLYSKQFGWGLPCWERDEATRCDERMPEGYLDYLTFRGRNIHLLENGGRVDHVLIACGDSFKTFFKEPFVPTKIDKKRGEIPLNLSMERLFWRDSDTLFRYNQSGFTIAPLSQLAEMGRSEARRPYRLTAYGIVNDQASPLAYVKESLPIPFSILEKAETRKKLELALSLGEEGKKVLRNAIGSFAGHLEIEAGGVKDKAETLYWQTLDGPFRRFLEMIDQSDALKSWRDVVTSSMRDAYRKTTMGFMTDKARGLEAVALGERTLYLKQRREQ
ncbi:CRISPR-associated protein, Cse1 family [Hydrogenimonas sp.]|nr:CRISPR-associated protein, Cse1 family [Hydrogenimonas sp.]